MMKKKLLITGLVTAAMLAVSACGSKTNPAPATTQATTTVPATMDVEESTEAVQPESTQAEETTQAPETTPAMDATQAPDATKAAANVKESAKAEKKTTAKDSHSKTEAAKKTASKKEEEREKPTAAEIKSFAIKVQKAVAAKDVRALANLCIYPVYVSEKPGEGSDVKSKAAFEKIGASKLFESKLVKEIAAVKPSSLEVFGAGVIMGKDVTITFNKVNGKIGITNINL